MDGKSGRAPLQRIVFPLAIAGFAGIIRPHGICHPTPMKAATKNRINAGILLGGIALAAITAPGVGVAACVGGVLVFMCGLGGNHAAKWFGDTLDASAPDHEDLFRNHHLRTLIRDAAFTVVASVIDQKPASSGTLDAAKEHIGAALDEALNDPKSPLAALHEFNLPDILTQFAKKKGKVKLLTVEIWEQFLDTLPEKLWKDERTALAEALHERFAEALWQLVKDDAKRDKQAFAAVELLYLSRILAATEGKADCPDTAPILQRIEVRIGHLDEKHTGMLQQVLHGNASIVAMLDARFAELRGEVRKVGKKVDAANAKLDRIASSIATSAPLTRYLATVREAFAPYENLGLPPPASASEANKEKDTEMRISQLFVHPACAMRHVTPEEFDALLAKGENPALPLLPRLAGWPRRVVLLADPGMGKSTLIQWLIVTLAAGDIPAEASALRGAIPLPFVLRDLIGHLPEEIADWDWPALVAAFRAYRRRSTDTQPLVATLLADEAVFDEVLKSKDAFFLIDGLDEIGDATRGRAIREAIWQGFAKYPEARWLLTSRVVGYEEAEVHVQVSEGPPPTHAASGWTLEQAARRGAVEAEWGLRTLSDENAVRFTYAALLYLAPFNNAQQLAFANNWYRPRLGTAAGRERAESFVAAVRRHESTRVIGRVPNLFYLLALLYRHKAHLPDGRAHV